MTAHEMFDGRVQLYQRPETRYWHCATRIDGKRIRTSTGEENLQRAEAFAEEWYLDLRGKLRVGVPLGTPDKPKKAERTFAEAADDFLREVRVLAAHSRSPGYIAEMEMRLDASIKPYFGKLEPKAIKRSTVQSYVVKRTEDMMERRGRAPARSTILSDLVIVRQILKFEEGAGRLAFVPSLSLPYLTLKKKGRRAWFSPDEYVKLYKATEAQAKRCPRRGWENHYLDLHDFVLFMANTGLRPGEAWALEFRDIKIEKDWATKQTILIIDVRGKTGVGYCKSTFKAVHPFERLEKRRLAELEKKMTSAQAASALAKSKVFPRFDRDTFNDILVKADLKYDRDGKRRDAYSLRHTYISMRLMEGANIHMIANNCRTSVQMIEEHYASHIKDRLDASAINVERPSAARRAAKPRSQKPSSKAKGGSRPRKAKQ